MNPAPPTREGKLDTMNTPGQTMRPLPQSSLGAIPDTVTLDAIATQLNRVQSIGRSPVGNEAARKLLTMVGRYAEGFRATPGGRTVPVMTDPAGMATRDELQELAAKRGEALAQANAKLAAAHKDVDLLLWLRAEAIHNGRHDFDAARAEVTRLSKALDTAKTQRDTDSRALAKLADDADVLTWLHAEALHWLASARTAADYHAAQNVDRGKELAEVRAEGLESRLRWAEEAAELETQLSRQGDTDREIARLEADLAALEAAPPRPVVVLTDEQIDQLHAELAALRAQPYTRIVVSSTNPSVTALGAEASKECSTCGLVKPLDEFHLRNRAEPNGRRHTTCKGCTSARQAARRHASTDQQ